MLIIGIAFVSLGLFMSTKLIYEFFFADNFLHFYIQQFMLPILLILLGGYSIYSSLKSGIVLKLKCNNMVKKFAIEEINENLELDELNQFLIKHFPKFKFNC